MILDNHPKRNRLAKRSRMATRRRGYAMLLVMVIIMSSSAFLAVHQRHLSAALRLEQARVQSETARQGPVSVLAVACQRMETGDPPSPSQYRYEHVIDTVTTLYRVSYSNAGIQWTVTAVPDSTSSSLSLLPTTF